MREYHYQVDRDGRVFHDGTEIVDGPTLRFFLRAMQRTPDGRFLVVCQDEHNWFDTHDTPFVVLRLQCVATAGELQAVDLCFGGDYRERLDPSGLEADRGLLYCSARRGAFRARFGRLAMQQIAPYLTEDEGGLALVLGGVRHPIRHLTVSAAASDH
jgi:hypothetical protein